MIPNFDPTIEQLCQVAAGEITDIEEVRSILHDGRKAREVIRRYDIEFMDAYYEAQNAFLGVQDNDEQIALARMPEGDG